MLGITTGAVRNRLSRGTLRSTKEDGTVYVLLPADMSRDAERNAGDTPPSMSHGEPDALTSELRDRLHYVEGQLEAERQAHAEARRLLAAALERIPAIEAPSEAEASDAAETIEEEPERTEPRSAEGEAREELGAERARREMAESTLREGMAEQRRRREEAERERDELRRQLYARREPRESPGSPNPSDTPTEGSRSTETPVEHPEGEEVWLDAEGGREAQPQEATEASETVEETPERAEPRSAAGGVQEGAQPRSWWRRILGR
jgi:hypothetical protein